MTELYPPGHLTGLVLYTFLAAVAGGTFERGPLSGRARALITRWFVGHIAGRSCMQVSGVWMAARANHVWGKWGRCLAEGLLELAYAGKFLNHYFTAG